jgi:predicted metal-binding membrane protein
MTEPGHDHASLVRSLPWRDRLAIVAVLAVVTVLSWVYLIGAANDMNAMMSADSMDATPSMSSMSAADEMKMGSDGAPPMDSEGSVNAGATTAETKPDTMTMPEEGVGETGMDERAMSEMNMGETAMGEPEMGKMNMASAMTTQGWTTKYFIAMLLMWVIMMIGMMVPTAAPMALIYAAIARKAASQGTVLAPTATFVSGYIVMWTLFSLFATLAQWGLDEAALLSPMMVSSSPVFGAAILIGAGIYQMTPMKDACLQHCRSPAHFISKSWRPGAMGAFRMGIKHGAYCLGCCWILMALLFFGGVMSLAWIAGITLFVLLEKVIPFGKIGGKIAGGGLVAWGLVTLGLWQFAS